MFTAQCNDIDEVCVCDEMGTLSMNNVDLKNGHNLQVQTV